MNCFVYMLFCIYLKLFKDNVKKNEGNIEVHSKNMYIVPLPPQDEYFPNLVLLSRLARVNVKNEGKCMAK